MASNRHKKQEFSENLDDLPYEESEMLELLTKLRFKQVMFYIIAALLSVLLISLSIIITISLALYFSIGFIILLVLFSWTIDIPLRKKIDWIEIRILNLNLREIRANISNDNFRGIETKFEKLYNNVDSLKLRFLNVNQDLIEGQNILLKKEEDRFEERVDSLLGRLKQSDFFGKIKKFKSNPDLLMGKILIKSVSEKISICKHHHFSKLLMKFTKLLKEIEDIWNIINEFHNEISIFETKILNGEYGYVIYSIRPCIEPIKSINSSELFKAVNKAQKNAEIGLNDSKKVVNNLLNDSKKYMEENNYEQARVNLSEAVKIYDLTISSPDSPPDEKKKFKIYHQQIVEHEQEFTVYKILLEFADRFPRVLLLEIINKSDMDPAVVEPIVKNLISSGKIRAEFDEETTGIEFKFAVDEIDALMKVYGDWERGKDKKK